MKDTEVDLYGKQNSCTSCGWWWVRKNHLYMPCKYYRVEGCWMTIEEGVELKRQNEIESRSW